jgi:hypothetical protein
MQAGAARPSSAELGRVPEKKGEKGKWAGWSPMAQDRVWLREEKTTRLGLAFGVGLDRKKGEVHKRNLFSTF